jgi:hypothetical protein
MPGQPGLNTDLSAFSGEVGAVPQGMEAVVSWISQQMQQMLNTIDLGSAARIAANEEQFRRQQLMQFWNNEYQQTQQQDGQN